MFGFTFLVPAHLGSPGQRAVKRVSMCVCVCVWDVDCGQGNASGLRVVSSHSLPFHLTRQRTSSVPFFSRPRSEGWLAGVEFNAPLDTILLVGGVA